MTLLIITGSGGPRCTPRKFNGSPQNKIGSPKRKLIGTNHHFSRALYETLWRCTCCAKKQLAYVWAPYYNSMVHKAARFQPFSGRFPNPKPPFWGDQPAVWWLYIYNLPRYTEAPKAMSVQIVVGTNT